MNPEFLLAHFNRISNAPDAIPRLRRFILELAVRGKLVNQKTDTEQVGTTYLNEPASDELPRNWRLLNFGKFCDIQGGNQPPKSLFVEEPKSGYVRLFQIRDLGEKPVPTYIPVGTTNRFCRAGEILIGRYGASVGKVFWAQDGAYNVALAKFIYPEDAFVSQFVFLVLQSNFFQTPLTRATRSAQAGFNKGDLSEINFPLPPLDEQRRIVTKLDELMDFCGRLGDSQRECDAGRDLLVSASHRLLTNGAEAETFRNRARFYISHLPTVTTHHLHIQQLRQNIFELAFRGQLVDQDPLDETAFELLKRIRADRARLIEEAEIRLQKTRPAIPEDTEPFPLPVGWRWVRFGELIDDADAGWSPKSESFPRSGDNWGVLKVSAVSWGRFLPEENKQLLPGVIPPQGAQIHAGDFLISRANTSELVAKSVIVEEEPQNLILSDKIVRLRITKSCNKRFLSLINNYAAHARSYYAEEASGTSFSMKNVSRNVIYLLAIPLPPLAEQHRIVAKVHELTELCDQLEAQVTTTQTEKNRLLESVLYHALNNGVEVETHP